MKYSYIDNNEQVAAFLDTLEKNKTQAISMDFEGEFNLHHYGEKLCLIQIFDGRDFYVIDPFRIDKQVIAKLFTSSVVKLFFSAGSDRKLVFRQYGVRMRSLLDLSDLVDILGIRHKGLDAILEELLSVQITKKKKYQRYDWTTRPLPEEVIQYSLSDVRYLFDLKQELLKRIRVNNLVESLAYRLAASDFDYDKKSIPGVKKKNRYIKLNQWEKNTFNIILNIRETFAEKLDKPPNSVISNEQLFQIAEDTLKIEKVNFNRSVPVSVRKTLINEISSAISSKSAD
jgi:ribonuclease D